MDVCKHLAEVINLLTSNQIFSKNPNPKWQQFKYLKIRKSHDEREEVDDNGKMNNLSHYHMEMAK